MDILHLRRHSFILKKNEHSLLLLLNIKLKIIRIRVCKKIF